MVGLASQPKTIDESIQAHNLWLGRLRTLEVDTRMQTLHPFLGEDDLIRVRGRLGMEIALSGENQVLDVTRVTVMVCDSQVWLHRSRQ